MKKIVIELCCSTSGGSGISSIGASVVVGGCVVVTGVVFVAFTSPSVLFMLKNELNNEVLITVITINGCKNTSDELVTRVNI